MSSHCRMLILSRSTFPNLGGPASHMGISLGTRSPWGPCSVFGNPLVPIFSFFRTLEEHAKSHILNYFSIMSLLNKFQLFFLYKSLNFLNILGPNFVKIRFPSGSPFSSKMGPQYMWLQWVGLSNIAHLSLFFQQEEDDGSPKEIRVLVNQGIVGGIIGKVIF